jgi:transcriptional regulator with XRE-family HTH domain
MNYNESYDVIVSKLRGLRAECDLSLDEVSEEIGVHRSTISLYEKGKRKLPLKTFLDLLELYNADIIVFFKNIYDNNHK